jgi:hypothetical protein
MRSSSSFNRTGLSLAEVLLVMALLLVVTGLMAGLVREYSEIMRFAGGKSHSLEVAQSALGRMASEVTEAATLDLPALGVLKLERLNPDPAVRLSRLPDSGAPLGWQPFAPDHLVEVTYRCNVGEILMRSVGDQEVEIADRITGLLFDRPPTGGLDITISTREERTVRTLSTHVFLPASLKP